jgi:competence protein ComEC
LRAGARLAESLPITLEGVDLAVEGRIVGLPQATLTGARFVFAVDDAPSGVPGRLSLSWFRGLDADALLAGPPQDLAPGQRWALTVRLKAPHGSLNPHGFDLELWMFERGLRAGGYVRASLASPPRLLAEADGAMLDRLRLHLRRAIQAQVPDPRLAGVLAALVVGDQGAIVRTDWDLFRDTGIAHLMAISGLHVTMFAWLAAALLGRAWRLSTRLPLAVPAPVAARWGGLALAAAYAALAGWGVPAQRTLCMLAVVAGVQQAGLRWPGPFVLLAAALVVSLLDPWALLQPGFWLSFGAVGLLMLGTRIAARAEGWRARLAVAVKGGLRTQAVATVGLAPLTLLFFQQVSLVGFVANLVAIPLVTLAITPLALAGALWSPLWSSAAGLLQGLVAVLEPLGALPVWEAAAAPAWAAVAGLLGGAVLVLRLPWRLRWLGLPLMLPLLVPLPPRPAEGRFELVAVDVGQGTAVLLRTHGHLLVYDAGPRWTPESDAGDRILRPLLRARGERRIDALVLSHRDTDHVGGAASLLSMPVGRMLSSLEPAHPLRQAPVPHDDCRAGQAWAWDGVRFEVLHPPAPDMSAKPNTQSCLLRVTDAAGRRVLLTGDLEAAQEAVLSLGAEAHHLRADVMMVPHHGSRTSSSAVFLDRVAPRIAFVQAAYRSRFGHPAPEVLARYAERAITVVRSDRCGAWTWDGAGPGVCTREADRRYWHHRFDP